jgi:adenylylsulfate kinase
MNKNITKQNFAINQTDRALQKKQNPQCIWFEGLSGSGKTTLINALDIYLNNKNYSTYVLDGDNLRYGLNSDLSFSKIDRDENLRRASEVASLMVDAGLIVLAGFITPLESQRINIRKKFKKNQFYEIYVSTKIDVCEKRDPKGLYKKARNGGILEFTGIDSPFEKPKKANIQIDTEKKSIAESIQILVHNLNL